MKRICASATVLFLIAISVACGGGTGSMGGGGNTNGKGQVFVTGEDAPLASVAAFNITINKITLNNSATSVVALNAPTAVDFGRLIGLRSLLGFNTIPSGTYTSATITFEASTPAPTINYVNLVGTPPSNTANLGMATGVLNSTTVTVPFPQGKPLVVGDNSLAGLHMDFDLRQSLAIDGSGNLVITGCPANCQIAVTPNVDVMAVAASDDLGEITEFSGNVVSVNVGGNSFVMQGPYGFQETIDVNSNTKYNGSNSLSSLVVDGIVSVEGMMQDDGSILASNVELITTDKAFVSGRILAIAPGPVVTMFVGEELGTSATIPVDTVQQIDLSGVAEYDICFIDNFITNQLFNSSSLVIGQRIFVGGTYQNNIFTPDVVSLRRQGVVGTLVLNSVNILSGNQGSFQMQNDYLMSYSAGGPFTVFTDNQTVFVNINGLQGLQGAGTPPLIARGLVFLDTSTQKPVVFAHRVRVLP